jgi:hypothetical protein
LQKKVADMESENAKLSEMDKLSDEKLKKEQDAAAQLREQIRLMEQTHAEELKKLQDHNRVLLEEKEAAEKKAKELQVALADSESAASLAQKKVLMHENKAQAWKEEAARIFGLLESKSSCRPPLRSCRLSIADFISFFANISLCRLLPFSQKSSILAQSIFLRHYPPSTRPSLKRSK